MRKRKEDFELRLPIPELMQLGRNISKGAKRIKKGINGGKTMYSCESCKNLFYKSEIRAINVQDGQKEKDLIYCVACLKKKRGK